MRGYEEMGVFKREEMSNVDDVGEKQKCSGGGGAEEVP